MTWDFGMHLFAALCVALTIVVVVTTHFERKWRHDMHNARMFALDLATRGDPDAKSAIADAEAFHAFLTK